jgi:hypothetical protein
MTVEELITEVMAVLQREGRISYRILKRRFNLDDEYLEDLKAELIDAKRVAVDEDGKVLVWVGNAEEDKGKRIKGKAAELRLSVLRYQLSVPSPQLPTHRPIWPSGFVPYPWRRASARPSPRSLPISKAPRP